MILAGPVTIDGNGIELVGPTGHGRLVAEMVCLFNVANFFDFFVVEAQLVALARAGDPDFETPACIRDALVLREREAEAKLPFETAE